MVGTSRRASIIFLTRDLAIPAALAWRKTFSIKMAELFELKSDTDSNDRRPLTGLAQQLPTLVSVSGAWRQFAQAPANFGFFRDRLLGFIESLLYHACAERRK